MNRGERSLFAEQHTSFGSWSAAEVLLPTPSTLGRHWESAIDTYSGEPRTFMTFATYLGRSLLLLLLRVCCCAPQATTCLR